jgi:hypothetical protein
MCFSWLLPCGCKYCTTSHIKNSLRLQICGRTEYGRRLVCSVLFRINIWAWHPVTIVSVIIYVEVISPLYLRCKGKLSWNGGGVIKWNAFWIAFISNARNEGQTFKQKVAKCNSLSSHCPLQVNNHLQHYVALKCTAFFIIWHFRMCITSLLLKAIIWNFHKLFSTLGKFVTLKHFPCTFPEDHDLHANGEQNCSET